MQAATLDLINLKNGMISTLSDITLAPGQYDEVRLFISAASVTMKNGNNYNLTVPSGAQTGLKVFINPSINITTQMSTDVLLDFDLSRSFIPKGNPHSPNGIMGFNFMPVIRAANLTTAGTLAGKIMSDNGTTSDASDDVAVNGAVVSVSQNGSVVSTAVSDESGNYKIIGLALGNYDFNASAEGYNPRDQSSTSITAGNVTTENALLGFIVVTPPTTP